MLLNLDLQHLKPETTSRTNFVSGSLQHKVAVPLEYTQNFCVARSSIPEYQKIACESRFSEASGRRNGEFS
jgi:hypothetical protein